MTCIPLSPSFNSAGEAWDALVPVTYVNPDNNQNVHVTVEVDTGAAYSLAPLSLATILGLNLASGVSIQLVGVGGSGFQAYLHPLTIQMPDGTTYAGVLIAIANTENVPFLLGRTNFWDFASIRIDDVNHQVCIDPIPGQSTATQLQIGSALPIGLLFLGLGAAALTVYFLVEA